MLHYLKLNYFTAHFGECQIVLREEILIKCNAHPSSRGNKINETPNPISPNGNYVRELHSSLVLLRNPWRRSDHRQTIRECIFIKFLFKFLINFMNNNFIINSISQPRRRRMSVCLWVFVPECVCEWQIVCHKLCSWPATSKLEVLVLSKCGSFCTSERLFPSTFCWLLICRVLFWFLSVSLFSSYPQSVDSAAGFSDRPYWGLRFETTAVGAAVNRLQSMLWWEGVRKSSCLIILF